MFEKIEKNTLNSERRKGEKKSAFHEFTSACAIRSLICVHFRKWEVALVVFLSCSATSSFKSFLFDKNFWFVESEEEDNHSC